MARHRAGAPHSESCGLSLALGFVSSANVACAAKGVWRQTELSPGVSERKSGHQRNSLRLVFARREQQERPENIHFRSRCLRS